MFNKIRFMQLKRNIALPKIELLFDTQKDADQFYDYLGFKMEKSFKEMIQ